MNLRVKPESDAEPKPAMDVEEQARRQASVNYGRGSVRLEGFVLSPEIEDLNRRYIEGELSSEELTSAILAHYAS